MSVSSALYRGLLYVYRLGLIVYVELVLRLVFRLGLRFSVNVHFVPIYRYFFWALTTE